MQCKQIGERILQNNKFPCFRYRNITYKVIEIAIDILYNFKKLKD